MPQEFPENDAARQSAPLHDRARHSLTIYQAVELFAKLGVPRSKRSVQRFCEQDHLDCVRIKGARGDQFFINRESVERYAEELRQIDAVASFAAEERQDVPQHVAARSSAPERATTPELVSVAPSPAVEPERDERAEVIEQLREESAKLRDENLHLRIDNRGKEQAINFITAQAKEKDQQLQDMSYRLGAAETRLAQLEAPKVHDDAPRHSAPEPIDAIVTEPTTPEPSSAPTPAPVTPELRRSLFGRLFG